MTSRLRRAEALLAFPKKVSELLQHPPETVRVATGTIDDRGGRRDCPHWVKPHRRVGCWASRGHSLYRGRRSGCGRAPAPGATPRAGIRFERQSVLDLLHTRFIDQAPAQVHATLLDEGDRTSVRRARCIASSTLRTRSKSGAIRSVARTTPRPSSWPPARTPCGAWDITKLRGPATWTYFYLLRDPRHLQSLRGRLDDRAARECGPRRASHRRHLRQALAFTRASSRSMRTAARR